MKQLFTSIVFLLFFGNVTLAQQWMTNLEIAQDLALIQNKMVLMVWEETTHYQYPVLVKDDSGRTLLIENLFEDETVSPLIWENFVPVIVSENRYADLYEKIKGKRKQSYIDKFNDDSIKIMDVNGNILNVDGYTESYTNITEIISEYAVNTEFIASELADYRKEKTFYSAFYLASKYLDFSLYAKPSLRPKLIDLFNIYLEDAKRLVENNSEDKIVLMQRADLLETVQYLIDKRPKKVLRMLKRMDADTIDNVNENFVAFLYYTAYMSSGDIEEAAVWKSKISSVNLKKAQMIINLNT